MKALTLFNGISALHLALDKAEIQVDQVYYAEIDKYANKVTEKHYPDDVALGDVTRWREWDIDWASIGLVGAGFPCQAWSVAGKQLGDKDERGMLFWTTLEIIAHVLKHNPKAKFLMENVKMKKEFEEYITHHTEQALGHVEKTLINSALVSAQNRQRYYWTNFEVTQPDDRGILLKDIIESEPDEKYSINPQALKRYTSEIGKVKGFRDINGKSNCLTASMHKGFGNDGCTVVSCGARDNVVVCNVNPSGRGMNGNVYNESRPKSPCLTTNKGEGLKIGSSDGDMVTYRKLTPIECERLQTFPDNYTAAIEKHSFSLYNYKETDKKEDLYLCDVKLMGVKGKQEQKSKVTYALCTTSDLLDMDLLSYQRLISIKTQSANIVIEKLGKKEVELEGCVVDITKTGLDMKTLYMQIKSSLNLGQEVTKNALVVKTSTGKLLRIISVESCQEMRLFTILIAIKLITQLRICMYVKDRASIYYCIDSLKESQGNLLSVVLSSLKMETTEQTVSNTQRYKSLGNAWTVDVIVHILKCAFK